MNFDSIINRRNSNSAKWDEEILLRRFGNPDLLPFWVADMDFPSPESVSRVLHQRADHKIFGYPATNSPFLEAWGEWTHRRHDWNISGDHALFVPGIVTAMSLGVAIFSRPGDGVIIQEPVYQPFRRIIERNNRRPLINQLTIRDESYYMDLKDLEEKAAHQDTTLLLLCSPHNPGGRVWTREELKEVDRICRNHNVFVISDEIHADLVLKGGVRHIPYSSLSEETALSSMTCQAPSKTFNIAGEKLSITVLTDRKKHLEYKKELARLNLHEGSTLALSIGEAAYKEGETWLEQLLDYLRENVRVIEDYLSEHHPYIHLMPPDAGFIGWLDFRDCGIDHKELEKRFLTLGKIAMVEGGWFGSGGDGFFRLNYGCPRSLLQEGLKRISASLSDNFVH